MKVARHQLVPLMEEASAFKKISPLISNNRALIPIASTRMVSGIALSSSDFSQKATDFDTEQKSAFVDDENRNGKSTKNPSNDLKVASIMGAAATGVVFVLSSSSGMITAVSSWLPMGMTVMIATLAAHGVRDGISGIWRKLRRNSMKRKKTFI